MGRRASRAPQLLAGAGREIRESVTQILLTTARARETATTDEQHIHLAEIESSADALLTVVNGLHDLADIEMGRLDIERVPFSIRKVVNDAIRAVTPRAAAKRIVLRKEMHGDLPDTLLGDPTRIRDVTTRVLHHVIDASHRQLVRVRVSQTPNPGGSLAVRLDIEDTMSDQPLEPPPGRGRAGVGSGLGGLVVTELVAAMGGSIWVDDQSDQVGVHLMIEVGGHDPGKATSSTPPAVSTPELPVLVIADSLDDRRSLVSALGASAMAPIALAYPYTARALQSTVDGNGVSPRAALIHVSDDPFEACETFLHETQHSIPVTMVSFSGSRGDAATCRRLGVAGYLAMPLAPGDLVDTITATARLAISGASPTLVTRHWLREDRRSLQILVADDSPVNRRLVADVLEGRGHETTLVENGAEAVEAVQNGSFEVVVMDVMMPVVDGLEATRMIRSGERAAHIPIVAITAFAEQAGHDRCMEAGVDAYLAKPWEPEELAALVEAAAATAEAASVR